MADENKNIGVPEPRNDQSAPPAPVSTPAPASGPKEEMVTVPKGLLEKVLQRQDEIEGSLKEKNQEIERLTYAADRSRLGIWDQRNASGQLIRKMNVGVWEVPKEDGSGYVQHLIRGWKMVADEVNVEDNGGIRRLVERQIIRLFLDQGEGKEFKELDVEYVKFYRNVKRTVGEVVKESRDENGEFRTLRLEDGRTIEMDIRFVNI